MLTPSSIASTAAGPDAVRSGSSTRTAGRLLTMLDNTAATAAMPSSASNVSPLGSTPCIADSRPCSMSPSTTTPRHNTNTRNGTSAAEAIRLKDVSRRASARTPRTTAPASAAHAGEKPSSDATANPTNVRHSTTSTNTGIRTGFVVGSGCGFTARSRAKTQRSKRNSMATAANHDGAITAVKWRNDRPAAVNASRLVRLDTGSNSDAVLARCAVAYACGRAGTRSARVVASTTGVSNTTVASRLSTAVVTDRKSTRLNSSHMSISYAVFCLKKKKKKPQTQIEQ